MGYGKVPTDNPVLAHFKAKKEGIYSFKLYPQLWSSPERASYYTGRKWEASAFVEIKTAGLQ